MQATSNLSYARNFCTAADRFGFSDLLWAFSTHFNFVRKPSRTKYETKMHTKYAGFTVYYCCFCCFSLGRVVFFLCFSSGSESKINAGGWKEKKQTQKKNPASHPMAAHVPIGQQINRISTVNLQPQSDRTVARYPQRMQLCTSEESSQY